METNNALLNKVLCKSILYLSILFCGIFCSFKSFDTDKTLSKKVTHFAGTNWAGDLKSWASDIINKGDGYDFAKADEKPGTRLINHNSFIPAEEALVSLSLTNHYNYTPAYNTDAEQNVASDDFTINYNSIADTGISSNPGSENSALASLAMYVPADLLESVPESGARKLLNMASSLSADEIARIKHNPEAYRARAMNVLSGMIR